MKKAPRELLTLYDVRCSRPYSERDFFLFERARQVVADLVVTIKQGTLVRDVKP
jgi:hypothetical protein